MKKILLSVLAIAAFTIISKAQTLNTPAPSPTQTIIQDFGLSTIEVKYSRPAMKGRTVFGDLVPYDAKWRTGANTQTLVTFGSDVTVGGQAVKAGKYSLITAPGKKEWTVMLLTPETSVFNFKEENVITTFKVPSQSLPFPVENFTIMFSDQTDNSVNIELIWEKTFVDIPVTTDVDAAVMKQIDKVMNGDSKPYFQAASYYYENGKDVQQALAWATKAAEMQPSAYWVKHLLAKVQAKAGMKKEAMATAKDSMALAEKAGNMDYVRLNEKLLKGM